MNSVDPDQTALNLTLHLHLLDTKLFNLRTAILLIIVDVPFFFLNFYIALCAGKP